MIVRSGSCLCGKITYTVRDAPKRVGICHCTDCRKETGSSFMAFGIWPRVAFEASNELKYFQGRGFCEKCGSRMFALDDEDVEIRLGSLDMAPTDIEPTYELWVKRRENWLHPLPVSQFEQDRT
jgi:hypothetical protein